MKNRMYISFKIIAAILLPAMIFSSCESRLKNVRKLDEKNRFAQTEGENLNLFYTDSGEVRAQLITPKLLDFTNLESGYREFPEGVTVHFYNKNQEKNTVFADYAISYENEKLVDLRGNVRIFTADSIEIKAEQLYWNQEDNWIFSDKNYNILIKNGTQNFGTGFDANGNFTKFSSRNNTGTQPLKQKE